MLCKVSLLFIDPQCCNYKSDEDGGGKAPNKCLTKEYAIESEVTSLVGWFIVYEGAVIGGLV